VSQGTVEFLIFVIVVAAAVGLHALLQRRFKSADLRPQNDVAGYLFSAVGVIYAVVLGFVVVVVWEKYDATVANVDQEPAALSDIYRTVAAFPDPLRTQVRVALRQYADAMVKVEWPLMEQRVVVRPDLTLLETMANRIITFSPRTMGQADAHQVAMTQLQRLLDVRRQRLIQSAPAVPPVLWIALGAGALAMLSFTYFFGVENQPTQLVMTAILAALIVILFIVIAEFDQPFSGSVAITPDAWNLVRTHLWQIP
jgi:hypothetical protein